MRPEAINPGGHRLSLHSIHRLPAHFRLLPKAEKSSRHGRPKNLGARLGSRLKRPATPVIRSIMILRPVIALRDNSMQDGKSNPAPSTPSPNVRTHLQVLGAVGDTHADCLKAAEFAAKSAGLTKGRRGTVPACCEPISSSREAMRYLQSLRQNLIENGGRTRSKGLAVQATAGVHHDGIAAQRRRFSVRGCGSCRSREDPTEYSSERGYHRSISSRAIPHKDLNWNFQNPPSVRRDSTAQFAK